MKSRELREKFLKFFETRGHAVVPSSSLLPDDSSVLLTTAGMQQFKPYYSGQADPMVSPHPSLGGKPLGVKNAVSIQKSFRTSDIGEIGDDTHLTFFEMMGTFSFGGYFKKEAIKLAHDFLVGELGLTIEYVTVFGGDSEVPKDEESEKIWNEFGFSKDNGNLCFEGREDNFWGPTGSEGPCGPTTEIYISGTEIWNIVFNEYYCLPDKTLKKLDTPGVDTGMGIERLAMASQEKKNIFGTDLFSGLIESLPEILDEKTKRIIADHARGVVFLISEGILPSNKEAGYVLRRLMRRMLVYNYFAKNTINFAMIFEKIVGEYGGFYKELDTDKTKEVFGNEEEKFEKSLARGLKELEQMKNVDGKSAFCLYESFGIPYEIIKELGGEKAEQLSRESFDKEFEKHREASRAGREKKFGGHGLVLDTGELKAANDKELQKVKRLHTATHLLQAALQGVLGDKVKQTGSDITAERLRFDFTFARKLTSEEIKKIEDIVNCEIQNNLDVGYLEMPYDDAIKTGALYFEKEKYPAIVRVYSASDPKTGKVFSKELCGGPHVEHTSELGYFKITKEESVGAEIRRIRAVVD